jgi:transcriptional regulator with XRE-family HTH domain
MIDAEQIKLKRKLLGLTLEQMARRLDVNVGTVWRWEQGRNTPTHRMEKAIRRLK